MGAGVHSTIIQLSTRERGRACSVARLSSWDRASSQSISVRPSSWARDLVPLIEACSRSHQP